MTTNNASASVRFCGLQPSQGLTWYGPAVGLSETWVSIECASTLLLSARHRASCDWVDLGAATAHPDPSLSCVQTLVCKCHASMSAPLEEVKIDVLCTSRIPFASNFVPEAMETVIAHDLASFEVQVAAIIGPNPPRVLACSFDLDLTSPTHSEVITNAEAWPVSTPVVICHLLHKSYPGVPASIQVRNAPHVLDVVEPLLKEAFWHSSLRGRWLPRRGILLVVTLGLAKVGPGVVIAVVIVELNGVGTSRLVQAHEAIS